MPRGLALQHRIADRLVYSKVKARLGGRLRIGVSGGAPLAKEIIEFFARARHPHPRGLRPDRVHDRRDGQPPDAATASARVGPALPGVELRIADDGEVLIETETIFAGYYKDEEATREILPGDGWLRSGDVGNLDDDGFLTITDRKKDILVTAGGKNVAPQNLENALKTHAVISQALVVGDRRPYVAALITLGRRTSIRTKTPRQQVAARRRRGQPRRSHASSRSSGSRSSPATSPPRTAR